MKTFLSLLVVTTFMLSGCGTTSDDYCVEVASTKDNNIIKDLTIRIEEPLYDLNDTINQCQPPEIHLYMNEEPDELVLTTFVQDEDNCSIITDENTFTYDWNVTKYYNNGLVTTHGSDLDTKWIQLDSNGGVYLVDVYLTVTDNDGQSNILHWIWDENKTYR